jgi:hypothetical protein
LTGWDQVGTHIDLKGETISDLNRLIGGTSHGLSHLESGQIGEGRLRISCGRNQKGNRSKRKCFSASLYGV